MERRVMLVLVLCAWVACLQSCIASQAGSRKLLQPLQSAEPIVLAGDVDSAAAGPAAVLTSSEAAVLPRGRNGPAMETAQPLVVPTAAGNVPQVGIAAVNGGQWYVNAMITQLNPNQKYRVISPKCPDGKEATACNGYAWTEMVTLSAVYPALGTSLQGKAYRCMCDFYNTSSDTLGANPMGFRCAAYCQ